MDINTWAFAMNWLKEFAHRKGISNIEAFGWYRLRSDLAYVSHPLLKTDKVYNRPGSMERALRAMSSKEQRIFTVKGADLILCGWILPDNQLNEKFVIILA